MGSQYYCLCHDCLFFVVLGPCPITTNLLCRSNGRNDSILRRNQRTHLQGHRHHERSRSLWLPAIDPLLGLHAKRTKTSTHQLDITFRKLRVSRTTQCTTASRMQACEHRWRQLQGIRDRVTECMKRSLQNVWSMAYETVPG